MAFGGMAPAAECFGYTNNPTRPHMTSTDPIIAKFAKIKPGDIITLTDEQTIKELMKKQSKTAMQGQQFSIGRIRKIKSEICDWTICDLVGGEPLFLVIRHVEELMDLGVYFRDEGVPVADRAQLIKDGQHWLFSEPENPFNYRPADLKYTPEISYDVGDKKVIYAWSTIGSIPGECREKPKPSGVIQPQFAMVTEYAAVENDGVDNPLVLVLEQGGVDEFGKGMDGGGVVTYFQGAVINVTDVDLMAI